MNHICQTSPSAVPEPRESVPQGFHSGGLNSFNWVSLQWQRGLFFRFTLPLPSTASNFPVPYKELWCPVALLRAVLLSWICYIWRSQAELSRSQVHSTCSLVVWGTNVPPKRRAQGRGMRSLHQLVRGPPAWVLFWSTDLAVPISDLQLLLYDGQIGDLYQVGAEATSYTDPETGTISGVTVRSLPHCVHTSMFCVKENS